ncbi:hypothetical protein GIB67_041858 [Kingdonia uniflora]|uniref:Uncharacterized protein n=1 Tax=Kingdonia uniflora TaxID=39325 RepID=A0A7J7L5R1_9MAGN|nr:hypothetical protein GIB67_041858 [Kingdonia uniflora]
MVSVMLNFSALLNFSPISRRENSSFSARSSLSSTEQQAKVILSENNNGRLGKKKILLSTKAATSPFDESKIERLSVKDFLEQSKDLIKSDGGSPRWFSPIQCGLRWKDSPLLLYLPGKIFLICLLLVY